MKGHSGSARPAAGSWPLAVYLGRDPVTGKKRYRSTTVTGGKRTAQRELARMVSDLDHGSPSVARRLDHRDPTTTLRLQLTP